tara:strand:+ start:28 stop:309 length:282 start_codon:yes stop_codon:yes gene_type:complete
MSDEELTPRELEELEELAIQKGELEVEKAKTEAIKLQEVEKERLKFRRESKGMVLTDIDLPFSKVLWLTVQFFLAGIIVVIPIYFIVFLIMFS